MPAVAMATTICFLCFTRSGRRPLAIYAYPCLTGNRRPGEICHLHGEPDPSGGEPQIAAAEHSNSWLNVRPAWAAMVFLITAGKILAMDSLQSQKVCGIAAIDAEEDGLTMHIEQTALPGVVILTPARHGDSRGFFSESWNRRTLRDAGLDLPEFVQDNHSLSRQTGTVRGLHYQSPPHAQGKLVRCGRGSLFDVAVDARRGSSTYGEWVGVELTFENGRQLWIPAGFLHGFVTREPDTEIIYKCTDHYDRASDGAVRWDSLGIDWGVAEPLLSDKDKAAVAFADWVSPFEFEGKE